MRRKSHKRRSPAEALRVDLAEYRRNQLRQIKEKLERGLPPVRVTRALTLSGTAQPPRGRQGQADMGLESGEGRKAACRSSAHRIGPPSRRRGRG